MVRAEFVLSHPFDKLMSNGWGTELLQGLKPDLSSDLFAARLKSCPVTKRLNPDMTLIMSGVLQQIAC
jgi:hypothetical protein